MRHFQTQKKLRVLVVDDSAYSRQTISTMLESNPEIKVVARAANGEEALKKALEFKPDVITLDLEMPKMGGTSFLRILMKRLPTPVIVISSHCNRPVVFDALKCGALDFVSKPTPSASPDLFSIQYELVSKVLSVRYMGRGAPSINVPKVAEVLPSPYPYVGMRESTQQVKEASAEVRNFGLVVLGASTGGPSSLNSFFQNIPSDLPLAYLVAQHMPPKFTATFAERLDRSVSLSVHEAEGGEEVRPGEVFIAPGGKDLVLRREGLRILTEIRESEPDNNYTPSINTLFNSAAKTMGQRVMAIVLTGMGSDGSEGIQAVKSVGGKTVAESEETAIIYGMPREAIATGQIDLVLRLDKIPGAVETFAQKFFARGSG